MIERLTPARARARAGELTGLYREAFRAPPWNEDEAAVAAFGERLRADTRRDAFVAVLAVEEGRPCGFGTAWRTPAPFPRDRSYGELLAALGPEEVKRSLIGALEVDELAVAPHARGRGLAGRLLAELCAGEPRCWLLTSAEAPDAVGLYERLGWRRLNEAGKVIAFTRRGEG
ncbi:GNAT family N-acetyltransferase [Nonomuraea typhae]|uniref:GNAT family N-acetyltransferase n=1 Tax=Nonomuraea typhae TaxID=2603600 RepID=UPI0012F8E70B|nr:GNAT family N-acetyltransferase [Nonomuraea typhae]